MASPRRWSQNRPDTMLEIQLLPAGQGDAIWVRWQHEGQLRQLVVDMGTGSAGKLFRERLAGLPESERELELLVVTHIDSDHIGGVLSCLTDAKHPAPVTFKDIWFNGANHCAAANTTDDRSTAQGSKLMDWLTDGRMWNAQFSRMRVARGERPSVIDLPGMKVTILGPPLERLRALAAKWKHELERFEGRALYADPAPDEELRSDLPLFPDRAALEAHAANAKGIDTSLPNGSSIVLLLECHGNSILLAGDAYAQDLVDGLAALGRGRVALDLFKVSHHGSKNNLNRGLLEAIDCPLYAFSSDGTQHEHPDSEAVACVLAHGRGSAERIELAFNEPSQFNEGWNDAALRARFDYRTRYGTRTDGLTIEFPAKASAGSPNSR